jgi:ComF family protein
MQDGFRELLHLWKFNNRPNLSRFLASLFKEAMIDVRAVPIASGTRPLLIPIPTQWHRQLWRGFDHTWLLAQALGHAINPDAEIRPWLRNSQKRQSHHQLSRALRWANSEGRFVGDPRIQGRKVVLIDDVMTTGATVSSAAHACHLAGARSVYIWCLARTPAPPSAG